MKRSTLTALLIAGLVSGGGASRLLAAQEEPPSQHLAVAEPVPEPVADQSADDRRGADENVTPPAPPQPPERFERPGSPDRSDGPDRADRSDEPARPEPGGPGDGPATATNPSTEPANPSAPGPGTSPAAPPSRPQTGPMTRPTAPAFGDNAESVTPPGPGMAPGDSGKTPRGDRNGSEKGGGDKNDRIGNRGKGGSNGNRTSSSRSGRDDRAAGPASTPSTFKIPTPRPMDAKYAVLLSRSIFSKEMPRPPRDSNFDPTDPNRPGGPNDPRNHQGPEVPPEAVMALRGVTIEDSAKYAFLENTATNQISCVQLGEKVARGTITQVSFSDIVYERNGRQTHVAIGYNLDGSPSVLGSTSLTSFSSLPPQSGGPGAPSGRPGSPSATPSTLPAGGLSAIEEAMRKRRMEQGGAR